MVPAAPGKLGGSREAVHADGIDVLRHSAGMHQVKPWQIHGPSPGKDGLLPTVAGPVCRSPDHFAEYLPFRIHPDIPFIEAVWLVPELDPLEVTPETRDHHVDEIRISLRRLGRGRKFGDQTQGGRSVEETGQDVYFLR